MDIPAASLYANPASPSCRGVLLTVQQYMNYDRYTQDPIHSPLFNGNSSSMGGNGAPDPGYKGVPQGGRTPNLIKSGGGGGCVTEGPFKESVTRH